jgi:hypothetical protein
MSYGSSNDAFNFSPLQEDDGWRPSGLVSGDFYREPDNVCRGVTISAVDLPDDTVGYKGGFVDGDFYHQPDDVCKGLSLAGSPLEDFSMMGYYDIPCKSEKAGLEFGALLQPSAKDDLSKERFSEANHPPTAPTDSFFQLELTTVFVPKAQQPLPCVIGNAMLDFLKKETTSVLTKVSIKKFAVKAEVFASVGGTMCSIKARVYDQDPQYCIEFQRRSGDTLTFNSVFKQAKEFFSSLQIGPPQLQEASSPPDFLPPQIPAEYSDSSEADLTPLHELCNKPESHLQAEAAGGFHKLAMEGNAKIYSLQTFRSIHQLLQSSSTEVCLPTSCLLSTMAKNPQAAALFASENMFTEMLDKASTPDMYTEIRLNFSQALLDAVRSQSSSTLSSHVARQLYCKLQHTTQASLCTIPAVLKNLQEAQIHLKAF